MSESRTWLDMISANPDHSEFYIERFRTMAAEGRDLDGEARMIDAMAKRGSRILDAGCGPGRVGGWLARAGHTVVGVDLDPVLIAEAEREHREGTWMVADLAELDLPARGVAGDFDLILSAGNVLPFVASGSRRDAIARLAGHLADGGRMVVGFGAGRGYSFEEFLDDAESAGLKPSLLLSTWDLEPLTAESDFLVAVLAGANG